jgi:hypothetical protein
MKLIPRMTTYEFAYGDSDVDVCRDGDCWHLLHTYLLLPSGVRQVIQAFC